MREHIASNERTRWTKQESKNEMTHSASSDIALSQFPEPIAFRARLIHLSQRNVHEVVAVYKVSVESLPILQFHELQSRVFQSTDIGPKNHSIWLTIGLFCAALSSDSGSCIMHYLA